MLKKVSKATPLLAIQTKIFCYFLVFHRIIEHNIEDKNKELLTMCISFYNDNLKKIKYSSISNEFDLSKFESNMKFVDGSEYACITDLSAAGCH